METATDAGWNAKSLESCMYVLYMTDISFTMAYCSVKYPGSIQALKRTGLQTRLLVP